jgi:hypothetical protein
MLRLLSRHSGSRVRQVISRCSVAFLIGSVCYANLLSVGVIIAVMARYGEDLPTSDFDKSAVFIFELPVTQLVHETVAIVGQMLVFIADDFGRFTIQRGTMTHNHSDK